MKYRLLVLLVILTIWEVKSQNVSKQLFFNISYFGILGTHPGVKLGVQYPIFNFGDANSKTSVHQMIGATNMIFYFHRRNQLGLGINFEIGYRNRKVKGISKELMAGLGYLRTFLPNKVYEFHGNDQVAQRSFLGANHLLKTISLGLGKISGHQIDSDLWLIRPTLLQIKPYNTKRTLNFALDVGYQFK